MQHSGKFTAITFEYLPLLVTDLQLLPIKLSSTRVCFSPKLLRHGENYFVKSRSLLYWCSRNICAYQWLIMVISIYVCALFLPHAMFFYMFYVLYSAGKNHKADRKIYKSQKGMELFIMQILFSFAWSTFK